jgi:glycosyltransferase 2 family protein
VRKTARILIGLIISGLALWLAFYGVDLAQVGTALREANYFYLVPAVLLIWLGLVFRALSWQVILGRQVPLRRAYDAMNEGYLLNNVLPFRLGEFGRAYLISRDTRLTAAQALSSVVVERVIDLLMLLTLVLAYLPQLAGLGLGSEFVLVSGAIGGGALVVLLLVARNPNFVLRLLQAVLDRVPWLHTERWVARGARLLEGLAVLRNVRQALLAAMWSGLAWVAAGLGAWALLRGFVPGAGPSLGYFVLLAVGLGNAIPSAPGAAGVFEFATVKALGVFGIVGGVAISFAVVFHLLQLGLTSLLGGLALSGEGQTIAQVARAAQALLHGGGRARASAAVSAPPARPVDLPSDQ